MSDSGQNDNNVIATLEQGLRHTRIAQNRLLARLREVEDEAERLRQEIQALENSAEGAEAAIHSLLAAIRTGNQTRSGLKNISIEDDYEMPQDLSGLARSNRRLGEELDLVRGKEERLREPKPKPSTLPFAESGRSVPRVSRNIEPISQRFADRTITQACTLLLRESGKALHVNELYNFLVAGGFEFKGNNPTISIAVSLNRNRRFRKVAPGTFDLVMRDASQAAS